MDIKKLNALKQTYKQANENPVEKIASFKEKEFIKFLLKEMDKTVPYNRKKSSAERYYDELLLNERAERIASTGNIGIKQYIMQNLK